MKRTVGMLREDIKGLQDLDYYLSSFKSDGANRRFREVISNVTFRLQLLERIEENGVKKKEYGYIAKDTGRAIMTKEAEAFNSAVDLCNADLVNKIQNEKIEINLKCGCFVIFYITERLTLQGGLACCQQHEHPNADLKDYYLSNIPEPIQ